MLMLSPFANADMDNVCVVDSPKDVDDLDYVFYQMPDYVDKVGCERNNILLLTLPYMPNMDNFDKSARRNETLNIASALWCRHDRNEKIEGRVLRCVLYDTKPRKTLYGNPSKD